jgi:nitrogen regulatory protein P-II 1
MNVKKVTAIVRTDVLEDVESRLRQLGVPGLTVWRVKGFGEYANFFTPDWMSTYARVEIFTDAAQAQQIVDTIMRAAHTGTAGDGIVALLPVDRLFRIRDGRELQSLHGPNGREDGGEPGARAEV